MKKIHIVCVYKFHSCLVSTFIKKFQIIIQYYPQKNPIESLWEIFILTFKKSITKRKKTIKFHG
jgi:hypothetical protein